jgi:hypothetical protein
LIDGESGRTQREATLAWLRAQGAINPHRYLRDYIPGPELLESRR